MAFERIDYHPDLPARECLESLVQELVHEDHEVFLCDERLSYFGRIVDQRISRERAEAKEQGYTVGFKDGRASNLKGRLTPRSDCIARALGVPADWVRIEGDDRVHVAMYVLDLERMIR